jgi:predicted phage terminase large subunit-like protein
VKGLTLEELRAAVYPPPPPTAADVWADLGWTPQPKQARAEALAAEVNELLFGGSVGGGKSEWLLHHAVAEMLLHPGNRGLILRRTMPKLTRSLLPRAEALLAGIARANRNEHTFTFDNGSVLEFGHLQHAHSVTDYQGAEYGFVGFEEVTEFLEEQWDALSARVRAPADGIRPHMAATTNPGGVGHRWVKRRWVKPKPEDVAAGGPVPGPGELWQAQPRVEGEDPVTRVFVPSMLEDNPALLRRDPTYRSRMLAGIANRAVRQAVASGDWDAIDAIEGALWTWPMIDGHRCSPAWTGPGAGAGGLVRVVVGVDPAATSGPDADETGIVVAGKGADGRFYILADRSIQGATPDEWGQRAVKAYRDHEADRVVAERNNGGDMVAHVLATVDRHVPVKTVWASRGKAIRAEPVAALYEQGKVSHAGTFPELEEQLTSWTPDSGDSPDRLDALVWALTELGVGGPPPAMSTAYDNQALDGDR